MDYQELLAVAIAEARQGLAEGGINQSAADAAHPDEGEEEPMAVGASAGRKKPSAARAGRR